MLNMGQTGQTHKCKYLQIIPSLPNTFGGTGLALPSDLTTRPPAAPPPPKKNTDQKLVSPCVHVFNGKHQKQLNFASLF